MGRIFYTSTKQGKANHLYAHTSSDSVECVFDGQIADLHQFVINWWKDVRNFTCSGQVPIVHSKKWWVILTIVVLYEQFIAR